jgi:TonB family protein
VGLAVAAAGLLGMYLSRSPEPSSIFPPLPSRPGGLRIETDPPGAVVSVDGKEAGLSPVALPKVRPGVHMVRVSRDGYAPAGLTLEVRNGEPQLPLRFVMEPLTAKLRLQTDPAQASVVVDGKAVGTTPLDGLNLQPGRHEVRVERRGYVGTRREIEASAGQTVDVSLKLEKERRAEAVWTPVTPPPVQEGDLVQLDASVTPPQRIKGEAASYPRIAEQFRMLGIVSVDFIVDEKGQPQDLHVVESAGEILDQAVVQAVRGWRFSPARKGGLAVKVHWQARQEFRKP